MKNEEVPLLFRFNKLFINGVPLSDLPSSNPPSTLLEILEVVKCVMPLNPDVRLHFISRETLKQRVPNLTHVGNLGESDYERQVAYVCESDDGLSATCSTLVHELLHLKDEKHRYHRVGDNFDEEVRYWKQKIAVKEK